ncbi:extracellular solute-binding protein [Pelagibius litoralis]|uniref:Putrescine-binding periplasmic protein n=1 Tax=Pelagibius litoralis TaxID=374515 RepID=A0A967KHI6_9PROT|nr:extracellular solute-binding protein [Pelagibius litoralis]NIA71311.1 extracellular solute-binding protein [Pelagibius litoralis]
MKSIYGILALTTCLTVAGAAYAEGQLNIYNWAGYTPPDLVKKFEAETGIDVTIDTYDTNEVLLSKLQAGGGSYDIIVTAHSFIPVHAAEGLIQPIGLKDMENIENLDPQYLTADWNPEGDYGVPWQWGTTAFAVDRTVYNEPVDSYETLFTPPGALQGKIGMFKGASDLISLAQLYLGVPFCSEDPSEMQRVLEVLLAQKPHVKVYGGGGAMREQLVSGELIAASNYSGQIVRGREQKPELEYIYPKEGVASWIDVVAIPKGAQNYENAQEFINYILQPEHAAMLSNHAGYSNGVPASREFMREDLLAAPELIVPDGIRVVPLATCTAAASDLEAQLMTQLLE